MIRQYTEEFTVQEPADGGRDDNNALVTAWTDPVTVEDAVIYRSPVEVSEAGRPDKRIHKARLTVRRWLDVSPYARVNFDGHTWHLAAPARQARNPYKGTEVTQLAVLRTTG